MIQATPRRQIIAKLAAVLPAAAVVLSARSASALRFLPHEDYSALMADACQVSERHRQLLRNAIARLPEGMDAKQAAQVLAALSCPTCGCPLMTLDRAGDSEGRIGTVR